MRGKKAIIVGILSMAAILAGGAAFGACFDIEADWDLSCKAAYYETLTGETGFTPNSGILHITDQRGCRFYGSTEIPSDPVPIKTITGVMIDNDIRVTGSDVIAEGTLSSPTRMQLSVSVMSTPASPVVNTALCTATRR